MQTPAEPEPHNYATPPNNFLRTTPQFQEQFPNLLPVVNALLLNLAKPWFRHQPSMVVRRAWQLLGTPGGNVVVRQPWGSTIELNPRETIGRSIWTIGVTDLSVCEAICRLLNSRDTAYDVGANIGFMTGLMAACVGPGGNVECFEPNPHVIPLLKRNLDRLRHAGFVMPLLHESAVADRSGARNLMCPRESDRNDGVASLTDDADVGTKVSVVALDDLQGESQKDVRLIKVDVEGHEASVFQGATSLLQNRRIEFIVFEEHRGLEAESFAILESKGYEVFRLGWTSRSIAYAPLASPPIHSRYESANFVATHNPQKLTQAFEPCGFRVFNKKYWQERSTYSQEPRNPC